MARGPAEAVFERLPTKTLVCFSPCGAMQAFQRVVDIIRSRNTEPVELMLSLLGVVWGIFVLNPLMSTFQTPPSFRSMNEVAPESIWGAAFLITGLLWLLALCSHLPIRTNLAFISMMLWTFVALAIGMGNPGSTGLATYGVVALASAWVFLRHPST